MKNHIIYNYIDIYIYTFAPYMNITKKAVFPHFQAWPPHHLHHLPRADTWPNAVGMGSDAWGWMDLREQKCGKKT